VNEPLAWPKNSLSNSSAGIDPQLTRTSGRSLRRLRSWMVEAISSYSGHIEVLAPEDDQWLPSPNVVR
jgi:hypothetical protein